MNEIVKEIRLPSCGTHTDAIVIIIRCTNRIRIRGELGHGFAQQVIKNLMPSRPSMCLLKAVRAINNNGLSDFK